MSDRRFVMNFRHDTGVRCIVNISELPGGGARVLYSFRHECGVPPRLAELYLEQWKGWMAHSMQSPVIPDLPAGWHAQAPD